MKPPPRSLASRISRPRDAAMKDSWSHGDDRRQRGRVDREVDRGVSRSRPSPSPTTTRRPILEKDEAKSGRAHRPANRESPRPRHRQRDRSRDSRDQRDTRDRRPPRERSPVRTEDVRERNRGRELLDTRGSDKTRPTHRSPPPKRRKTRSPSPARSHHKRSRRHDSRSPVRESSALGSSRHERKHRDPTPPRKRRHDDEKESHSSQTHRRDRDKESDRDSRPSARDSLPSRPRRRTPSPRRRPTSSDRRTSKPSESTRKRSRSPVARPRSPKSRGRSPLASDRDRRSRHPTPPRRRSPEIDRYEPASRHVSPRSSRAARPARESSPKRHSARDEYRPRARSSSRPPRNSSRRNSEDNMQGRGGYGVHPNYIHPNQQMQAAFPQRPQVDTRYYSQSPQHFSPQQVSPQAQSPYSARGGWGGGPQYSPGPYVHHASAVYQPPYRGSESSYPRNPYHGSEVSHAPYHGPEVSHASYRGPEVSRAPYHGSEVSHAPYRGPEVSHARHSPYQESDVSYRDPYYASQVSYPPDTDYRSQHNNYPQGGYVSPQTNHGQFYQNQNHSQSPPYVAPPTGPQQSFQPQTFRGSGRGFRGNTFNPRGGYRGRGHFQNLRWNANSQPASQQHSTHVTPQQSPAQANSQHASPQHASPQNAAPPASNENEENMFRPSKELQVEESSKDAASDEKAMPPPSRPPPTGPQASKFSFVMKAVPKAPAAAPKPEISQKLNTVPTKPSILSDSRNGATSRPIPTEPASSRARVEFQKSEFQKPREPAKPRMIKRIEKRLKPKPTLPTEFAASDSVYYRKPGNESVVGSGTYGKVFKAIHVYTKKLVALKKIRMEGERDGFPVTAVREIKLLQSLKHPNVVDMQEVMVEKNDCFMVFEYLSHDLTGLLNHPTFKLEPSHKKHLAKQLFEGLDYLHRKGVLHRDIKAANILVSNEGQLKLADFGLARFYAKRRQLDYTNRVITIWYRSPELLLGETQYGPAVDIWSAACVLVEIFTRHAIFPGDGGEISQLEKIYAVLGTPNRQEWPGLVDMAWFELLRPTYRRPNVFKQKYAEKVTPAAYDLLEAMFQYDPAKRPSAGDVLEHPYFTTEEPKPRQAVELQALEGDWHEFESKALRKENERKEKEARRAQREQEKAQEKEKKRGVDADAEKSEAKRQHTEAVAVAK